MVLSIKARHLAGDTTIPTIHPLPLHSRSNAESARRKGTNLSVAICSFAIALRSSWLVAADMLVRGVAAVLPFVEPAGVEPVVEDASLSPLDLTFADCLAAFSARRFCFEAEGAMKFVKSGGRGQKRVGGTERRRRRGRAAASIDLLWRINFRLDEPSDIPLWQLSKFDARVASFPRQTFAADASRFPLPPQQICKTRWIEIWSKQYHRSALEFHIRPARSSLPVKPLTSLPATPCLNSLPVTGSTSSAGLRAPSRRTQSSRNGHLLQTNLPEARRTRSTHTDARHTQPRRNTEGRTQIRPHTMCAELCVLLNLVLYNVTGRRPRDSAEPAPKPDNQYQRVTRQGETESRKKKVSNTRRETLDIRDIYSRAAACALGIDYGETVRIRTDATAPRVRHGRGGKGY